MATITTPRPAPPRAGLNGTLNRPDSEFGADQRAPTPQGWGNAGPLALLAFAVVTFMLSMINAKAISAGVTPVVLSVGLFFGGGTQLIAGLIQLRSGNTFQGVLFSSFGAFWIALAAFLQWFVKDVPPSQVGHSLGLLLYAFGIVAAVMLAASFRTSRVVVGALCILVPTFFLLAMGNYGAHPGLIKIGGYTGILVAAIATYLALAELCEFSYGRAVLPVWPLAKP
jgi:succinate-acetate transporter protein